MGLREPKGEKNPQQIKNRGGVSRKKLEKVDLRIRNQIKKKGGEISGYFLIKTRVLSRFYLVVCLYPWRTHLLIGLSRPLPPKRKKKHQLTMAQENLFPKILPTNNIAATIHPLYPTDKLTYIDHSIDSVRPCKIYPESSDISNGAPIEFVIHDCSELFLDLGSIKLEVSLWILDEDGQRVGVDGAANVYFTNNLLSSLFPVVKVFINNTNVESQYFAHHIANLNRIKEISNALAINRGRASGVFALEKEGVGPVITAGIQAANAARKAFSKKDLVYVKGYLNLDVASSNKWLVDGSTVRIVLDQSKANQLINSNSDETSWRYEIKSVRLLAGI